MTFLRRIFVGGLLTILVMSTIDAHHFRVASCLSNWGVGTKKMLEGARESA
jgi:hypothetical protein